VLIAGQAAAAAPEDDDYEPECRKRYGLVLKYMDTKDFLDGGPVKGALMAPEVDNLKCKF
jgi:hypothetical protein